MELNKSKESTNAIERIYITMRHLFYKGMLKPSGYSGLSLRRELLKLQPEIYGSMSDANKVEIKGLSYVLDRLPKDIEQCSFINLTSDEGLKNTSFKPIIPKKRRRNCYRIDDNQMNIEILLGYSEIYDILTHLTFMYMEADKICSKAYSYDGKPNRIWKELETFIISKSTLSKKEIDVVLIHLSSLLGRVYDEIKAAYEDFKEVNDEHRFLKVIYYLGKTSHDEKFGNTTREITFSDLLRERVGHHIYGSIWSKNVKKLLLKNKNYQKKIHVISANMHSVMNMFYAFDTLEIKYEKSEEFELYQQISNSVDLRKKITEYAKQNGMIYLKDYSGSNIDVQLFDLSKINLQNTSFSSTLQDKSKDLILVFDYAFGEQAFEILDELFKPNIEKQPFNLNVESVSIMGKAGILVGKKGDIMIPASHISEGTVDNYPFDNDLDETDFIDDDIPVFKGSMLTVLGTSLQNKDILNYFFNTTWKAIGLEMEGAHYQKAIQIASKIRNHISSHVKVRYVYYASDNPLESGSTLASGGLGLSGVKPTYIITKKILKKIIF